MKLPNLRQAAPNPASWTDSVRELPHRWRDAAGNLDHSFKHLSSSLNDNVEDGVERALERLGLERRRQTRDILLPALGLFGAGVVVGAALGVVFAPKRGQELRGDIRHRLEDMRARGVERYDTIRTHEHIS